MTTAESSSQYLSGQGVLLLASKDPTTGEPLGSFRGVANVSALTIGVSTTEFEHKESMSGVRGVDLIIVTDLSVSVDFTMESLERENLALVLKGSSSSVAGASVTAEAAIANLDLWFPLDHVSVSAVVVTDVGALTTFTLGTDYEVDLVAGAIRPLGTGTITETEALEIDYTFALQEEVEALTLGANPIRWGRFHGLNTADSDNPIVVDIFKMSITPLEELALINDEISQMAMSVKALSDVTRVTGSKFFKMTQVATN